MDVLRKTSLHFEKNNAASTTAFDNLRGEYTWKLMKAIVAFEIAVEEVDHVFKLSLNRDKESYQNSIQKLEDQGGDGQTTLKEMKQRIRTVFPSDF